MNRREAIAGSACLLAAGAAVALRPRNKLDLLHGIDLDKAVPRKFGAWVDTPSSALIVAQDDRSLQSRLYSQIVGRLFVRPDGASVMLLLAYGNSQTDTLQLHRPEICYPSFGFTIQRNEPVTVALAPDAVLPGRELTAYTFERTEQIFYWTRLGQFLPQSGRQQLVDRLRTQVQGIVADGILVRISSVDTDLARSQALNHAFAREFMHAVSPALRPALVGSDLAHRLSAA